MKRSIHNLTHYNLFTADMGQLVPICCVPVLPGDTFRHNSSVMVRLSPMVAPVMHPLYVRIHHFFVPNRLLWNKWEDFITGGKEGVGVNPPLFPTIKFPSVKKGSLMDYFGINPTDKEIEVNALPFRAYNLIYNEYFRDQDLVDELDVSLDSGVDEQTEIGLMNVAWNKDYFTTSRPTSQKGMEVTIPVNSATSTNTEYITKVYQIRLKQLPFGSISLSDIVDSLNARILSESQKFINLEDDQVGSSYNFTWTFTEKETFTMTGVLSCTSVSNHEGLKIPDPVVLSSCFFYTDSEHSPGTSLSQDCTFSLSFSYGITKSGQIFVNDLRLAMALQRFEEEASRWGSRYVDYLRNLGVNSSDSRLQIPEYLGGGRFQIQTSEVLQTAAAGDAPVGSMYGHGLALGRSNRYIRFFEEHGYVITLFSVLPENIYSRGLKRDWLKRTFLDYWHPTIQNLGQQEVYAKELWQDSVNTLPFGYQDRFDEYRFEWSQIHGDFRDILADWHLARDFETEPYLNSTFITANPTKRPFASQSENVLWCACFNAIKARRLISQTAKPRLL